MNTEAFMNGLVLYTECSGAYFQSDSASRWTMQWNVRGDMIDFVVSAVTTGWVGIGFSEDAQMVSNLHGHKMMWPSC